MNIAFFFKGFSVCIWDPNLCRWRKVGEICLVTEEHCGEEAWGKMGDRDFFPPDKDTIDPGGSGWTHAAGPSDRYRPVHSRCFHVFSHTLLPPPSFYTHKQTWGKFGRAIHGHPAEASEQTSVAIVMASHTHMCGIRGQGSWVVLLGLNGALCVIIETSHKSRAAEGQAELRPSRPLAKSSEWKPVFHISGYDQIMELIISLMWYLSSNWNHSLIWQRGEIFHRVCLCGARLHMCKYVYMHPCVGTYIWQQQFNLINAFVYRKAP